MNKLIFLFLFLLLILIGCSSSDYKSSTYRKISSIRKLTFNKIFKYKTARQRLVYLEKIINKTYLSLPHQGNPRFYLFDFFSAKSLPIILETKELQHLLDKKVFIPETTSARNNILKLIYYYKVINEAGIYLNYSQIINKDSPESYKLLSSIDYLIYRYETEINEKLSLDLYPEKKYNLRSQYRLELIKYLLLKIESKLDLFITDQNKKRSIFNDIFAAILNISYSNKDQIDETFLDLINSNNYQLILEEVKKLSLPDSGSIDGSQDSFEKVMSVQLSFELINFIIKRQLRDRV